MSGSDATVMVAGQLLDIVDDEWRADVLPFDEIEIPPGISVPGDDGDDAATQAENDGPQKWNELARLVTHWAAFTAWLPAKTVFLGVWLSGLITATIVTVTHQSEEIFIKDTLRK